LKKKKKLFLGCKPTDNAGGFSSKQKMIEQAILYKWESFEPQYADKLYKLDLDSLEVFSPPP
jgi:hypothetical protein